jgi:ribosome-associated toxin RatA of RatAB toxin-antitoxin module
MSVSKYTSEVKIIQHNQEVVYNYLSDFKNFSSFFNEYTLAQISQQFQKVDITGVNCETDTILFTISQVGEMGLGIVDREPMKMIKVTGTGRIPFELFLWIQILPVTSYQCKIRLTIHAHLNVMMKMLIGKKMHEGINKLANAFTLFPYK